MDKNRKIDFTHIKIIDPSPNDANPITVHFEINASSIQDRPMITLKNAENEESYTLPADFMFYIQKFGAGLIFSYNKKKEDEQYQTNHPRQFADIIQYQAQSKEQRNSENEGKAYSLAGHNLSDEMTPFIRWTSGVVDTKGVEVTAPSWNLYLVGAKDTCLLRVAWDNKTGIEEMLEAMKDPEALLSALALLNTEVAQSITSRRIAVGLKTNRDLPAINLAPLKKFLKDQGLDGGSTLSKNKIGILAIQSEGARIPIGLIIDPGYRPIFGLSLDRPREEGYDAPAWRAKMDAEREVYKKEWLRRFETNIESIGWRIVGTNNKTHRNRNRILITCLHPAVWRPLEVAAIIAYNAANPIVSF